MFSNGIWYFSRENCQTDDNPVAIKPALGSKDSDSRMSSVDVIHDSRYRDKVKAIAKIKMRSWINIQLRKRLFTVFVRPLEHYNYRYIFSLQTALIYPQHFPNAPRLFLHFGLVDNWTRSPTSISELNRRGLIFRRVAIAEYIRVRILIRVS